MEGYITQLGKGPCRPGVKINFFFKIKVRGFVVSGNMY